MCIAHSRNCTFLTLSSPSLYTDPATLPRHDQDMKALRVIRTNYSLLWQHLDASKVLPKLVDKSVISEAEKRKVESYQQSCGQNAVIINALFTVEYVLEGLMTICDVLQTTPGKEHIAQHILRGTIQSVFRFRLLGGCSLTSTYTLIFFSLVSRSSNHPVFDCLQHAKAYSHAQPSTSAGGHGWLGTRLAKQDCIVWGKNACVICLLSFGNLPTRLALFNNLPDFPHLIILYTVSNQNWTVGMV